MNLKSFVDGLTLEERRELLDILTENSLSWTTMPPHIEEMLSNNNDQSEPTEEDFLKKNTVDIEDFSMKRQDNTSESKKKKKVQARENTWVDTGEDRHIKTPEKPLTPRTRKPPSKKEVQCHVCGKTRKVNASLVYGEYYRCDRCTGNR
jgi:hypothetical protein